MTTQEAKAAYEELGRLVAQAFNHCKFGNDLSGGWLQDVMERMGLIKPLEDDDGEVLYKFVRGAKP